MENEEVLGAGSEKCCVIIADLPTQCGLALGHATHASKIWHFEEFLSRHPSQQRRICRSHPRWFLLDVPLDVQTLVNNILDNTSVPDFEVVWGGSALLLGDLSLLVPAVDNELVMVHKSLEGVGRRNWGARRKKRLAAVPTSSS